MIYVGIEVAKDKHDCFITDTIFWDFSLIKAWPPLSSIRYMPICIEKV